MICAPPLNPSYEQWFAIIMCSTGQEDAVQQRKALTKKCAQLESRIDAWHLNTAKGSKTTAPTPTPTTVGVDPPSYNDAIADEGPYYATQNAPAAASATPNATGSPASLPSQAAEEEEGAGAETVRGLSCAGTSPTTVTLEWDEPAAAARVDPDQRPRWYYEVVVREEGDDGDWHVCSATIPVVQTMFLATTGMAPGRTYRFKCRLHGGDDDGWVQRLTLVQPPRAGGEAMGVQ